MDQVFDESDDFEVMVDTLDEDYLLALSLQTLEDEFNSEENKNRKSIEIDYELALSLSQIDGQIEDSKPSGSSGSGSLESKDVVSPQLELLDPNPNIWHLMKIYDQLFFGGVLAKHCIELSWSSRMTRTAGLCAWSPSTNYCSIQLSLPLLQLRSRRDLVETLIHEMIHALLFVTHEDDNHQSHGQVFHQHMYRINRESGANITVYHNFHDEVDHYLKHIWRCEGKCRTRPPYFGYVKRSMNRAPGPYDYWFKYHQQSCGGKFVKISEPSKSDKKLKPVTTPQMIKDNKDIRGFLNPTKSESSNVIHKVVPFSGFGRKIDSNQSTNSSSNRVQKPPTKSQTTTTSNETVPFQGSAESYAKPNRNRKENRLDSKEEKDKTKENFEFGNHSNHDSFKPFSGKGFVLGSVAKESLKPKTCPPKRPKDNIEVIEID